MEITIYHNPNCSKSRAALELLRRKSYKLNVIEYLQSPLGEEDIKFLLKALNMKAIELVRRKEQSWACLGLQTESSETQIINAMLENRELIERPIVVNGSKAAIGRPMENIMTLLES
ncbi:MAG: arsenate reductase (glutaredoxin) [Gammaproteobacteria bacterium]|jgi:arsenate reductase|tara:strand:+ start:5723 stop:6073 length:351 start_codon:yes stop_codon:yes gene_type:complete